ncbi:MAG: Rho termination factor N-terminal domain-containing protein [Nostocales cyanobacterium LE14-WE12]|jgi:hypothetical protein|nr:Rho termination factor N-terminal domain-containing protein [Nostocales cyanobacterium LE14-WE12]
MTTLDTMILDYIAIGAYWAFNATVVFFTVMMIISGVLHAFWGILEGVDSRIFYPQNLHNMDTTDTQIDTQIPNLENLEEDLNLVSKIESISQVAIKQELVESEVVSIRQLKVMARELKIKGYGSMTKQQLIEKIQQS